MQRQMSWNLLGRLEKVLTPLRIENLEVLIQGVAGILARLAFERVRNLPSSAPIRCALAGDGGISRVARPGDDQLQYGFLVEVAHKMGIAANSLERLRFEDIGGDLLRRVAGDSTEIGSRCRRKTDGRCADRHQY